MKLSNFLLMVILLSFCGKNLHGQNCQVLVPAIAGKYTGGCFKGKAEGNGKAEGTDLYTGRFKAGIPDGKGTYQWKNGDVFKGEWVMGLREGPGSLAIKRAGKADSVINGMWKNDIYTGVYEKPEKSEKPEKPFTIYQKSNYFSRVDVRKNSNSRENSIEFTVSNVTGGTSLISGRTFAPAQISDIMITSGSYGMVQDGPATPRGTTKRLMQVNFPFRATIRIGMQDLDLEIAEPGAWTVILAINQ